MRRMMRYSYGKGWILKDIFFNAKVIEMSAEIERTRLLTLDEENRLLAACQGEREVTYKRRKRGNLDELEEITGTHSVDNPHLKGMIILALDAGMRRGSGKAIIATARKFLGIIYRTLKYNWVFSDFPNFVLAEQ